MLYPIKFFPLFFEKIWGGNKLKILLNKPILNDNIGESWEISSVENHVSLVANRFLKGNSLNELVEVYMTDLLGEKVYEKYGNEFPLLIKFINASDILSVQVHPNDEIAKERHHAYGKTEMWYIVDADADSYIYVGFNKNLNKEEFIHHLEHGTVESLLNKVTAKKGDVFFIPPGRIHAIGKGILLAEIQQTSDITYRVFDWNRKDKDGNYRELHIEEALDILDYTKLENPKIVYQTITNKPVELVSCSYFSTNLFVIDKQITREYEFIDSFKILIFIDGNGEIIYKDGSEQYTKGDVYLIPADLSYIDVNPLCTTNYLEVFVK